MLDPEIRKFIKLEIERQVNIILSGESGTNDEYTETIENMFPGQPPIEERPVMHPWGFVSRAVKGCIQVVARQGAHFGNRLVLGHRDKEKPLVAEGECAVYSIGGYILKMYNSKIQIGLDGDMETMVVGETLIELLEKILDAIIEHTHITTAPGSPTPPPINSTKFVIMKAQYLSTSKILCKDGGRY